MELRVEGASGILGGGDRDVGTCVMTFGGGLFRLDVRWGVADGPGCWGDGEGAFCWTADDGVEGNSFGVAYSLFGLAMSRLRTSVEGFLLWIKAAR